MQLKTPIISILIGNGGSGGALALCISDEILALEYSVLSVISPRACANILWKDLTREMEAASMLKITSQDLLEFGIINKIIREPDMGAHTNPEIMVESIRNYLISTLQKYSRVSINQLLKRRNEKYRRFDKLYI